MLRKLANAFKYYVCDMAHPLPEEIEVNLGGDHGSLKWAIAKEVLRNVHEDYVLAPITRHAVVSAPQDPIYMKIGDEQCKDLWAIVRYLGKLMRRYPMTPLTALWVDESLDQLATFVTEVTHATTAESDAAVDLRALVEQHAHQLESRMTFDAYFLESMDDYSIADFAWLGAFKWVKAQHFSGESHLPFRNTPCVRKWWTICSGDEDSTDEACDDDETTADEEDTSPPGDEEPRANKKTE